MLCSDWLDLTKIHDTKPVEAGVPSVMHRVLKHDDVQSNLVLFSKSSQFSFL
jgi:hypothetical protein